MSSTVTLVVSWQQDGSRASVRRCHRRDDEGGHTNILLGIVGHVAKSHSSIDSGNSNNELLICILVDSLARV
jgi:hypothetical protein